jgi:hypothetical protein
MYMKHTNASLAILLMAAALTNTGCVGLTQGPDLGFVGIPIPVSPYFQKKKEDDFWIKERYERVPILGPLTAGGPAIALDPPSDDEVIRALERARPIEGGLPLFWERNRNNVRIVKERSRTMSIRHDSCPQLVQPGCTMPTTSAPFTSPRLPTSAGQYLID